MTILAALALLALACGEEEPFAPEGPGRESPNGVLQLVAYAFNHQNDAASLDCYKATLSPAFKFYFDPDDVGRIMENGYEIPRSWDYDEDWKATGDMFDDAYNITLYMPQIGAPGPGDTDFYATGVKFDFVLYTRPDSGCMNYGWCDFYFEKQADDTWRLVKWWDHMGWPGGGMPVSFGFIKAMYHS